MISWTMTDGISTARKMMSWRPVTGMSAFRGAVHAVSSRWLGLQPGLGNGLVARLAQPVPVIVELGQGVLDLVQRLPQLGRDRLGLAPLGGDLAGIGEVRVVFETRLAVAEAEVAQLRPQRVALVLQRGAQLAECGVGGHEREVTCRGTRQLRNSRHLRSSCSKSTSSLPGGRPRSTATAPARLRTASAAIPGPGLGPGGGPTRTPPSAVRPTPWCT